MTHQPASDTGNREARSEVQRLESQLERWLEGWGAIPSVIPEGFMPLADVEETDDAYVVELELPGVDKGDIDISVTGRRLTVSGERKEKERVGILRRRTRSVGRFHFEIVLPSDVNDEDVKATLDDGVLVIRVPKAMGDRPRRIRVD
jgi:HSP20 family protein